MMITVMDAQQKRYPVSPVPGRAAQKRDWLRLALIALPLWIIAAGVVFACVMEYRAEQLPQIHISDRG